MKKQIAFLLVVMMVAAMAAGCFGSKNEDSKAEDILPKSSLAVLENIWALYKEDEKFFAVGGDLENSVDNAPANYSLDDKEMLTFQLLIPEEQIPNVDQAASLIHAMNSNTFTGAVFHMTDKNKANDFAKAMHDTLQNKQWTCGIPEKMFIAVLGGEYVLVTFGMEETMETFRTHFTAAYPGAKVAYDKAIG